jgi:hypothetical protein
MERCSGQRQVSYGNQSSETVAEPPPAGAVVPRRPPTPPSGGGKCIFRKPEKLQSPPDNRIVGAISIHEHLRI